MDTSAKQVCQEFFRRQMEDARLMYERVTACQCEHFGGNDCVCYRDQSSEEDSTLDSETYEVDSYIQDPRIIKHAKDSATSANQGVHPARVKAKSIANEKVDLWRHRMMSVSGKELRNIKPFIKQASFDEHSYDGLRNPFVIVINNVAFKGHPTPRHGADADIENVKRFLRKANFTSYEIRENLDKNSMRRVFECTRENPDLVNYDGLICFIMSHGSEKGILTVDNTHIQVDEITTMFGGDQCQSLATKPKLFFIQACRGNVDDRGFVLVPRGAEIVESDKELDLSKVPVILPSDVDFLVAYSTTKGKSSYRQYIPDEKMMSKHIKSMGTWFISCLTQIMLTYSHEDLLTMLTRVNKAMSELYTVQSYKQVSCYHSVLTKKVYFPTISQNEGADAN